MLVGTTAGLAVRRSVAAPRPKVCIVGAGAGGVAAARTLLASYPDIDISVVEPNPHYTCCFSSGAVVAGLKDRKALDFSYQAVSAAGPIQWIRDHASRIDAETKSVHLGSGDKVLFDRLILSPGISIHSEMIGGWGEKAAAVFPHAYVLGGEIDVLIKRLAALEDGELVLLSAPERPYRCTPAPYERASMIAHYLKTRKPRSKLIVLDSKNEFPLMDRILPAWDRFYGDLIEWVPADFGGKVTQVNGEDGTVIADGEEYRAGFATVIPPQRAGHVAVASGLTDKTGWCPIDPQTLESKQAAGIHIIGDAVDAGDMSKSAHAAASMGRNCAVEVGDALTGKPSRSRDYENACYFMIAPSQALKVGGRYRPIENRISGYEGFSSAIGESDDVRRQTAEDGEEWFTQFTNRLFA